MHVHLCVCYFLDVAIIQAYYTSSYTDFSRAVPECFNSGHLNQKAFCYSYIQSLSQLRKSPHSCGPKGFQEFTDASERAVILFFQGRVGQAKGHRGYIAIAMC